MVNVFKRLAALTAFCCAISIFSGNALADCLSDLKKYQLDKNLYNECLTEAKASDYNPKLHYLFGLWHISGVQTPTFTLARDMMTYRHFMFLAGKAGNMDAKSMYVITEYSVEKAEKKQLNPYVIRFLDDLAADKSDEGVLRYLLTRKQIVGLTTKEEVDTLKGLADKGMPLAALEYGSLLLPPERVALRQPKSIDNARVYYEKVINDPKASIDYKGMANWKLYEFYMQYQEAEYKALAEPYLKNLAYMGDIIAQGIYASTFLDTTFGVLDEAQAYAWNQLAKECAKRAPANMYSFKENDERLANLTPEILNKGNILLGKLRTEIECPIKELLPFPAKDSKNEADNTKDKNSQLATKDTKKKD